MPMTYRMTIIDSNGSSRETCHYDDDHRVQRHHHRSRRHSLCMDGQSYLVVLKEMQEEKKTHESRLVRSLLASFSRSRSS